MYGSDRISLIVADVRMKRQEGKAENILHPPPIVFCPFQQSDIFAVDVNYGSLLRTLHAKGT